MCHNTIYDAYKDLMPFFAEKTEAWFPCGLNTIRVRLNTKKEYVFNYNADKSWQFQTIDLYIKNMKGKRNSC